MCYLAGCDGTIAVWIKLQDKLAILQEQKTKPTHPKNTNT